MITVNTPDGGTVQFPAGTPPEVMKQALAKRFPAPVQPAPDADWRNSQPPEGMVLNPITGQMTSRELMAGNMQPGAGFSAITGGQQGITFGFGDELQGGLKAITPGPGTMGERYDYGREQARAMLDKSRADHPVAAYGGEIAGAIMSPLNRALPGGGATLGAKSRNGAIGGAIGGGLYGFGAGEGDIANRAGSAATGAALGLGVGAAFPAALSGLRAGGRLAANPVKSALNISSQTQASGFVQKLMERSGKTEAQIIAEIQAAVQEGQPMYAFADAMGAAGQNGLAGVTRQPGNARQVVTDMLNGRQGRQGGRIAGFLGDALDAPDTAAARVASIKATRDATADTAYSAARANAGPVDVRGAVDAIDQRIGGMQGSGVAGDGIDAQLGRFRARLAAKQSALPAGTTSRELSDFDRVLGVKQDVQDAIGVAVRAGRNNEARELGKLQSQLDAALEASSDGYRAANDSFRASTRAMDAVDAGKAATSNRVRASDTATKYGKMPADQQAAFKAGYADPLIASVDSAAPGVNKARPLLDTKNADELGLMASDPALLQRQLGREDTMFETRNAALGGSKTADNLGAIADSNLNSASVIVNAVTGNWTTAARQFMDKFAAATKGQNPKTRELIAKMLISQDPRAALVPAIANAAKIAGQDAAISGAVRAGVRPAGQ